ncbi:MAG: pilus assembly protein PilM [Planctomycetaceae bacterium]
MASQAIGVDIGTHAIKVAVLQKKGATTRAMRLFRAPVLGDTDMVRVQGALARAGVSGTRALVGVTGRDLIIRYTHLPIVPDWRLQLLMQFEINEVSGQSGGEVAADFRRLKLPLESGEDTVLVALTRNSWLQPRLDAGRAAGIKATGGCANSVAVFNAYRAHGPAHEGETVYLVNLGRENIDMAILREGELLFARNIAGGGKMFTDAIMQAFGLKEGKAESNKLAKGDLTPKGTARYPDATAEKLANAMQGPAGQLVSMVQSSVMVCRAQTKMTDLSIDRLVLTGGGARMKGIREYFQTSMSVPVELFDPVEGLDVAALPPQDAGELGDAPLDFAVAVGLAETLLQPQSFKLEILTEKARKSRRFMERTLWALGAAAAAAALVVLLFTTRSSDIKTYREANARLERRATDAQQVARRGDAAAKAEQEERKKELLLRMRTLPGHFARSVLSLLHAKHPKEHVYLETVDFTNQKVAFNLDGQPVDARGTDTTGERLPEQVVWPLCEVVGVVQDTAPSPDDLCLEYIRNLKASLPTVEGRAVDLETESLDSGKPRRFRLKFRLASPEKGS